jgi:hypothetical protein
MIVGQAYESLTTKSVIPVTVAAGMEALLPRLPLTGTVLMGKKISAPYG